MKGHYTFGSPKRRFQKLSLAAEFVLSLPVSPPRILEVLEGIKSRGEAAYEEEFVPVGSHVILISTRFIFEDNSAALVSYPIREGGIRVIDAWVDPLGDLRNRPCTARKESRS